MASRLVMYRLVVIYLVLVVLFSLLLMWLAIWLGGVGAEAEEQSCLAIARDHMNIARSVAYFFVGLLAGGLVLPSFVLWLLG
jgi:hypothetical protein